MRRDRDAFSAFVQQRQTALFRTAYLLAGDRGRAEDLLQSALVQTYVAWPRLRRVEAAEAYTRRVLAHTVVSWARRRSYHEVSVREVDTGRTVAGPEGAVTEHSVVWEVVRELPPRQRAVVVLRFYEDLSVAETADLLRCTEGTVKSQTHEAMRHLRTALGAEALPKSGEAT